MKLKILIILIFPAFFFSCMTAPKNISYFQDLDEYQQNIRIANEASTYEPIIKKYDELMITITAPVLDQVAVAQFNLPMTAYLTSGKEGETSVQQSVVVQTYTVDHNGDINFPVIGQIPLAGLTKSQAIEKIKKLVSNYIADPVVVLKIMSFKITILGEVGKPGTYPVSQEKISILDAIGAANDLTIYGNRQNVLLIRENGDGTTNHIRLDLTKSDIFTSPYYYLQQNDVIYVESNKTKQIESKYGVADNYKLSILSMVFSAVSIIASTTVAIVSVKNK